VGSSPRWRARAGKSHRRQTGEGVEAGVEVDVEVPGTRAVLGVEQVWPEEDQRRRSTVAEARRRWRLEWSGRSSTVTVRRGVNGFSSGPTVRGYGARAMAACAARGAEVAVGQQRRPTASP
jgi:hypothetical protein